MMETPDHVKQYLLKQDALKTEQLINHSDFFMELRNSSSNWVTIAEMSNTKKESREKKEILIDNWIFSVFISGKNRLDVLQNPYWDINPTEPYTARPLVEWESDYYYPGFKEENKKKYEFFSIFREFSDSSRPACFEFLQHFLLFHNCYKGITTDSYVHNIDGMEEEVAKIIRNIGIGDQQNIVLQVKYRKIIEYLAATDSILAIYFQNRRYDKIENSNYIKKYPEEKKKTIDPQKYITFEFRQHKNPSDPSDFWNEITGKKLILPPPDPKNIFLRKSQYAEFIYKVTEEGKNIEFTCDRDQLSNRFETKTLDDATIVPMGLTPIYFKMEVLDDYLQNPQMYWVGETGFSIEGSSGLSYDKYSDEYLVAYLCDIGLMPYKEQLHWKKYNVEPQGDVPEIMILRDEFIIPPKFAGSVDQFKRTLNKLNQSIKSKFKEVLFLPPKGADRYILQTLFIPTSNENIKSDNFIINIAKLTSDSISSSLVKQVTLNKSENRPVFRLGNFLIENFGIKIDEIGKYTDWLIIIQAIRSTSGAHRKGSNYDKTLVKWDLADLSNIELCKSLIDKSIKGLEHILSLLQ